MADFQDFDDRNNDFRTRQEAGIGPGGITAEEARRYGTTNQGFLSDIAGLFGGSADQGAPGDISPQALATIGIGGPPATPALNPGINVIDPKFYPDVPENVQPPPDMHPGYGLKEPHPNPPNLPPQVADPSLTPAPLTHKPQQARQDQTPSVPPQQPLQEPQFPLGSEGDVAVPQEEPSGAPIPSSSSAPEESLMGWPVPQSAAEFLGNTITNIPYQLSRGGIQGVNMLLDFLRSAFERPTAENAAARQGRQATADSLSSNLSNPNMISQAMDKDWWGDYLKGGNALVNSLGNLGSKAIGSFSLPSVPNQDLPPRDPPPPRRTRDDFFNTIREAIDSAND